MLSIPTQMMLCEHFKLIAYNELELEVIRQVLSEQNDFDISQAYLFIAKGKSLKKSLTADLIKEFLSNNDVHYKKNEINHLVRTFDSESNGCLNFFDFLTVILPSSSSSLRHISQELIITTEPQLNYESLWSLIKVFQKILENQSKIEKNLLQIKSRYDYNDLDAFNSIDIENLGYIDADAIFNFFNKNKDMISDNEILLIFRKIDKDQDAKISLKEFEDEMNNRGVFRINKNILKSPMKSFLKSARGFSSAKKKENSIKSESTRIPTRYSPLKKAENSEKSYYESKRDYSGSPERVSVSQRRLYKNYKFNEEDSDTQLNRDYPLDLIEEKMKLQEKMLEDKIQTTKEKIKETTSLYHSPSVTKWSTPKKTPPGSNHSSVRKNINYEIDSSEEFKKILKTQIELDRELEISKNELALQVDFNLLDAFRFFDTKGKGYLSPLDFANIFDYLDLNLTEDEIRTFLSRFDRNDSNQIRYSDFCDIFTPKSNDYYKILNNRVPTSSQKEVAFSKTTKTLIRKVLLQILTNEKVFNDFKKNLGRNPSFSLEDAFLILDKKKNGFITIDEFQNFLSRNMIRADTTDLINLMKRYDKNRDGKVTLSEFIKEITPKKLY